MLRLSYTKDLQEFVDEESFLLQTIIVRYNKYGWKNIRTLILTQDNIMILKQKNKAKKELRLKVTYQSLKGVTISLHANSIEFVLHLEMQADVRVSHQH